MMNSSSKIQNQKLKVIKQPSKSQSPTVLLANQQYVRNLKILDHDNAQISYSIQNQGKQVQTTINKGLKKPKKMQVVFGQNYGAGSSSASSGKSSAAQHLSQSQIQNRSQVVGASNSSKGSLNTSQQKKGPKLKLKVNYDSNSNYGL